MAANVTVPQSGNFPIQGAQFAVLASAAGVPVSSSAPAATISIGGTLTPLGVAQDTTISAASGLPTVSGSIPAATTVALIQVTGQNCRWRDDGTDPTASVGIQLGAGTSFWYRGTFSAFKIIEEAASAVLNVAYFQEVAE